ncbi:MAG TPA: hypothetical protein VMX54_21165 [Vicinamibacteria bacterium]|nr:hypothetical protein [Vicinamibacteria bacterium]
MPDHPLTLAELMQFHREVFLPDFERLLGERDNALVERLGKTLDGHFAEMHRRFDRLDALVAEARATMERIAR